MLPVTEHQLLRGHIGHTVRIDNPTGDISLVRAAFGRHAGIAAVIFNDPQILTDLPALGREDTGKLCDGYYTFRQTNSGHHAIGFRNEHMTGWSLEQQRRVEGLPEEFKPYFELAEYLVETQNELTGPKFRQTQYALGADDGFAHAHFDRQRILGDKHIHAHIRGAGAGLEYFTPTGDDVITVPEIVRMGSQLEDVDPDFIDTQKKQGRLTREFLREGDIVIFDDRWLHKTRNFDNHLRVFSL